MGEFQDPYRYPRIGEPTSKPILPASGSIENFIDLLDTLNDYTGHALKLLQISADETRIEATAIQFASDKHFAHAQIGSSANWGTINHALEKYPSIQIFDDSGNVAHATITHVDEDNVTITSDVAFAGIAYFN